MSEALDWNHGVFQGAALKSEATAAAEHKGKVKFRTYLCKPLICSKHYKGRNTNARRRQFVTKYIIQEFKTVASGFS